jgi:galactose mutarotase-like enzyme
MRAADLIYPFEFEFRVRYQLRKAQLNVTYEVTNTGKRGNAFSVGAHPAFALPLSEDTSYEIIILNLKKRKQRIVGQFHLMVLSKTILCSSGK